MYISIMEISFIILSLILVVQMTLLYKGVTKNMKPSVASNYVSSVVMVLFLYILNALVLCFLLTGIYKSIMFILAVVPFLIGRFVKYETYRSFTLLQNFIIICGIICVCRLF